ncbi:MAG: MarR family winged helix-turn-helix transcriptional regulator [Halioglobus sp.]
MNTSTAERNREVTSSLANDLSRLLREFSRDYERRIGRALAQRGYPDIRPAHCNVLANLGTGAVRVTELAERTQVTQQAMGKMLKELERMGYVARDVDSSDKRARAIRLTEAGTELALAAVSATDAVRAQYAAKVGELELAELESNLRRALGRLDLDYLPDSWAQS